MKKRITLADVEAIPKEMLSAADIAPYLGVDAQYLRIQAREDKTRLPFTTVIVRKRVKFPKASFVAAMKGGGNNV